MMAAGALAAGMMAEELLGRGAELVPEVAPTSEIEHPWEPIYTGAQGNGKSDAFYAYSRHSFRAMTRKEAEDLDRQIAEGLHG